MKKYNKFMRSQSSHRRLMKKAQQQHGLDSLVKTNYHSMVHGRQQAEKRILSRNEKKKIYNDFVYMFTYYRPF